MIAISPTRSNIARVGKQNVLVVLGGSMARTYMPTGVKVLGCDQRMLEKLALILEI